MVLTYADLKNIAKPTNSGSNIIASDPLDFIEIYHLELFLIIPVL